MTNAITRILLGAVLIAACGGTPAKVPDRAPTAEESASSPPPPTSSPTAATDADAGATAEAPAASAVPATPTQNAPAAGVIAEGHDDCAAAAAPFEEKVRAKFNECYQAGKKKNPELAGTIKVTLKIDMKGKVTKYVPDPSKLDAKPFECMVKAVKKEPFDAKACRGKDVTVSKTFGQG
jgi:hypothetical protein